MPVYQMIKVWKMETQRERFERRGRAPLMVVAKTGTQLKVGLVGKRVKQRVQELVV